MKVEENIQKIALIFFFVIGLIHIISYLMIINRYLIDVAIAVNKIFEIPFILTAAIYGFITLKLGLTSHDKKHSISNIIFFGVIIVLFAALIYLNIFIPDRT